MSLAPLLIGLHPGLILKIQRVLAAMQDSGHPMKICQGLRTTAQQAALYAQGRRTPGPIVTNADGITHKSRHQAGEDGLGHAVDCCFIGPDPFSIKHPWKAYGAAVEAEGLTWGGSLAFIKIAHITDLDHAELA